MSNSTNNTYICVSQQPFTNASIANHSILGRYEHTVVHVLKHNGYYTIRVYHSFINNIHYIVVNNLTDDDRIMLVLMGMHVVLLPNDAMVGKIFPLKKLQRVSNNIAKQLYELVYGK